MSQLTDTAIAMAAQQTANRICDGVMVNVKRSALAALDIAPIASTNQAFAVLQHKHFIVSVSRQSVHTQDSTRFFSSAFILTVLFSVRGCGLAMARDAFRSAERFVFVYRELGKQFLFFASTTFSNPLPIYQATFLASVVFKKWKRLSVDPSVLREIRVGDKCGCAAPALTQAVLCRVA